MRLERIGYWLGEQTPEWRDPRHFVDPSWVSAERAQAIDHLRRGTAARAYLGKSSCRFCGEPVGSLELSDGVFIWPEGLAHYVEVHDVRLPQRFVDHVVDTTRRIEEADVDDEWWSRQTGFAT